MIGDVERVVVISRADSAAEADDGERRPRQRPVAALAAAEVRVERRDLPVLNLAQPAMTVEDRVSLLEAQAHELTCKVEQHQRDLRTLGKALLRQQEQLKALLGRYNEEVTND